MAVVFQAVLQHFISLPVMLVRQCSQLHSMCGCSVIRQFRGEEPNVLDSLVQRFSNCGPRVLPLWSFQIEHQSKKDRKNKINVNCVSHTIVENLKHSLEITYNKRLKLSLPGLTFHEIYYPTYSTLSNKRGIFCCKNMFRTLFRAGIMSLINPRVGWSVEHSD